MGRDVRDMDDAIWLESIIARDGTVPVPPALEARILSSFDACIARRNSGPLAALGRGLTRLHDAVWPAGPLWKPAAALALSLAIGIVAGSYLPPDDIGSSESGDQTASIVLDAPPSIELGETL